VHLVQADQRWAGCRAIVAATGPSLTAEQAALCRGERVIAVNDAHRLLPWADVLYACDGEWIKHHKGCPDFTGEKWTSHGLRPLNDKTNMPPEYGFHIIAGEENQGFSFDLSVLHYGRNSGFQGINLALLFGANPVILIGFDMRRVGGADHFFGNHPSGLRAPGPFSQWVEHFETAAKMMPAGIEILNATPGSALACFPMVDLADVLREKVAA
jgi:hypothetical protein